MKTLAFESSTARGTIALLEDGRLIEEVALPVGRRTTESFAPALDQLLHRHLKTPQEIDLLALTSGPGSFTGLRIGVTLAKAFAFATQARIVALNTLEVLVHQLPAECEQACVVMDAQRRQFFAGRYQRGPDSAWTMTQSCHIVDRQQWLDQVPAGVLLTGPGLLKLSAISPTHLPCSDRDTWEPRAATVGQLAWLRHVEGRYDDLWALVPQYYRPSYAEEKRR